MTKIRKYFQLNANLKKQMTYQNMDAAKAMLKGKFIELNASIGKKAQKTMI